MKYRIHMGYTAKGRDRWRYYPTFEAAQKIANEVARRTGVILTIEAATRNPAPTSVEQAAGRG